MAHLPRGEGLGDCYHYAFKFKLPELVFVLGPPLVWCAIVLVHLTCHMLKWSYVRT